MADRRKSRGQGNKNVADLNNGSDQPKKFQYQPVLGRQVGPGWLSGVKDKSGVDTGKQEYRRHLLAALTDARDRYVQREKEQGGVVPKSILENPNPNQNLLTTFPSAPKFSEEKHGMYKMAGNNAVAKMAKACVGKDKLKRFFIVDHNTFQYYEQMSDRSVKKALKLEQASAFLQEKKEFNQNKAKNLPGDEWKDEWVEDVEFRIGMRLKERDMKPVYFYSKDLHSAKFLHANIELYGDSYKAGGMPDLIELSSLIEKVTRFQKIIKLLCYAQQKRFVAMHQFQQVALNMVEIASQSQEYRKLLAKKWLTNMLTNDQQPTIRSPFRSANPMSMGSVQPGRPLNEARITELLTKLSTFIKNRRYDRSAAMSKKILDQAKEEATGKSAESITYDAPGQQTIKITGGQASIIMDAADSFKYLTIEDKTLDTARQQMNNGGQSDRHQENQIRKIKFGDISFISTDLDQTTQFDANNRINQQDEFNVRLYGRIQSVNENSLRFGNMDEISPGQLGLDVIRKAKPKYRISVTQIKFPPHLATQVDQKLTFQIKLYQFAEAVANPACCFESTSQSIKIKGCNAGIVYPQSSVGTAGIFNVNQLTSNQSEKFSVGLVIKKNSAPIQSVAERFLESNQVLKSHERKQFFSYDNQESELYATLSDEEGNQYELTFSVTEMQRENNNEVTERSGKRLLVGRYVLYEGNRVAFVKKIRGDGTVDIIETITRSEHRVHFSEVDLIEKYGVNVFMLGKEPKIIEQSMFSFTVNLKFKTKEKETNDNITILNLIHQKIRFQQAHLDMSLQDLSTQDPLNTIEGNLKVSLLEVKGLIVPIEVNRRSQDFKNHIDPVVEIRLDRKSNLLSPDYCKSRQQQIEKNFDKKGMNNRREIIYGPESLDNTPEFEVNLGLVKHSGETNDKENKIERSKSMAKVTKPQFKNFASDEVDQLCIHVIVRNQADNGQELGDAMLEVDEVIDTQLSDLAQEHCVCLNRSHIINEMKQKAIDGGKKADKVESEFKLHTRYSGVIRFQTLFLPTPDTSLRFQQKGGFSKITSPAATLHLEYLLAKSDFDNFKYKIPQIMYDPNDKIMGEKMIGLDLLIAQCKTPEMKKIRSLLQTMQSYQGQRDARQQATASLADQKIDEVIQGINSNIKFQSPFEKLYIILKLKRKERPYLEQVFYQFKKLWNIYIQDVKNQGFASLNQNEWYAFIDELSGTHDFDNMDDIFAKADDAADEEDDMAKSAITDRSASFIGETIKQMNNRAAIMKEQSAKHAQAIESGSKEKDALNFSLLLCPEWEKNEPQTFVDLANLVKCGIPVALRTVAWGDFVKVSLIKIEEKKNLKMHFSQYLNSAGSQISQSNNRQNVRAEVSPFQTLYDLSQKFDSTAFRQIDQDISDFKFPAHYYEETSDQNSKMAGWEEPGAKSDSGPISRVNKLKRDKQEMRKLLRVLLVWGKNFQKKVQTNPGQEPPKFKVTKYQLCYPSGFLKVVHRFINLMSMEDAFWILIGFIRQYPRLWCLEESSMLDDAKSNFRFELTAIKAIIEVAFPSISQKLYQLGVPAEMLVYDSMSCLYCDYFHSDILLRIWDLMFFYFVSATDRKRGIWLLLAPALLILRVKQAEIESAQTAQDALKAFRDGCGIDYNPNKIIQGLNEIIDDIFVIEGKQAGQGSMSTVGTISGTESTVTGVGAKNQSQVAQQPEAPKGFLASVFAGSKKQQAMPQKVDKIRLGFQNNQNVLFSEARSYNKAISDFLFKNNDEAGNQSIKGIGQKPVGNKGPSRPRRPSEDSGMDFENDEQNSNDDAITGLKPLPHQALEYRRWRQDIIPSIQDQFLMAGGVPDDDLHEIEDTNVYQKQRLDIRVIYVYLHNLENWFGTDDGQFQVVIHYGRLHSSGKFEVKGSSSQDDDCVMTDSNPPGSPNLQFFSNFTYSDKYNQIKINITSLSGEKICHCYVDLRGQQRSKFVFFKKTMNSKEYTDNLESNKPTTQLKMSMFLESKRDQADQYAGEDELANKMAYLYSLKKIEPGNINIYKGVKEQNFQKVLATDLQHSVLNEYQNYSAMKDQLGQYVAIDMLNYKYIQTDILPRQKNGHLALDFFEAFIQKFLPEHARIMSRTECQDLYQEIIKPKQEPDAGKANKNKMSLSDLTTKQAILDIDQPNNPSAQSPEQKVFSLRSFIFSVLHQSPITVKEKLDLLYDLTDMSNKSIDGIDIHDAHMIYETILRQHLYYVPSNELRTEVENVFNQGCISAITGAYWTCSFPDKIKYDMNQNDAAFCTLQDFLDGQTQQGKCNIIDITKEVQETFAMYQNLFGNKVIDFNDDTSPFKTISNIFASSTQTDLGNKLLQQTKSLGPQRSEKYRLCLLSQVTGGERIMTEVKYTLDGNIKIDEEKQPQGSKQFKRFFMKNINVLDLSGGNRALDKHEFIEGTMKIPMVYDLMRAETFWQDRRLHSQDDRSTAMSQNSAKNSRAKSSSGKPGSLRKKTRFDPEVTVQISVKEKNFTFKFVRKVMQANTGKTQVQLLSSADSQIKSYKIELDCLFNEDIILDMRDRIVNELKELKENRGMNLGSDFISEVEGKMEFFVRKIKGTQNDERWEWRSVNDFDRVEKFSDDEVFDNEVVFKLSPGVGVNEELLDEQPQHLRDGYDCYSIYKHADNSYEWRLCKIVGKVRKPEFKQMAIDALVGGHYGSTVDESDQWHYSVEFLHLKEFGSEMRVKRRREDVIFSARYARDQSTFVKECQRYIQERYQTKNN